ncbi:MerR family transcriptional regulator [Shewanella sp. MEBiC00475]|uniref:MerR family transcriptional regulator n=1 Tax=Shewanella sp. MEBiC00475 TaxID=2575361 RepID=UPI0010C0E75F|nr:MerR family transcriptional regulator [Shewanella sp. MEBiC00475]
MKVSELAALLGVTTDTIRFYTRIGLLVPTKSPSNGYKFYRDKEVSRMRFILSARNLGFSVDEIKVIFSKTDHGESACIMVKQLISQKLAETEKLFNETLTLRNRLTKAVLEWENLPALAPTGAMVCHLIEGFDPNHETSCQASDKETL